MEFKGITVGTYISRKPKNKNEKDICANCEINTKIQKVSTLTKKKNMNYAKIVTNAMFLKAVKHY